MASTPIFMMIQSRKPNPCGCEIQRTNNIISNYGDFISGIVFYTEEKVPDIIKLQSDYYMLEDFNFNEYNIIKLKTNYYQIILPDLLNNKVLYLRYIEQLDNYKLWINWIFVTTKIYEKYKSRLISVKDFPQTSETILTINNIMELPYDTVITHISWENIPDDVPVLVEIASDNYKFVLLDLKTSEDKMIAKSIKW